MAKYLIQYRWEEKSESRNKIKKQHVKPFAKSYNIECDNDQDAEKWAMMVLPNVNPLADVEINKYDKTGDEAGGEYEVLVHVKSIKGGK